MIEDLKALGTIVLWAAGYLVVCFAAGLVASGVLMGIAWVLTPPL